jgi:hypothetical protein
MGKTKTSPYDPAEYLRDDADMVAYLEVALEDGDPRLVRESFIANKPLLQFSCITGKLRCVAGGVVCHSLTNRCHQLPYLVPLRVSARVFLVGGSG